MILYRPRWPGRTSADLRSGPEGFSAASPGSADFYPVLNQPYAGKIPKDWNMKSGSKAGFVTHFEIDDAYATRFERRIVGSQAHEELWVPAEELAEFNEHIVGAIRIVEAHFGEGYIGLVPDSFGLKGKTAHDQFVALTRTLLESGFDAVCEIAANHIAVFLNFCFWELEDFGSDGIDDSEHARVLGVLKGLWSQGQRAALPLGLVGCT
ncbi:MAG: hypothetical protein ABW061_08950 [Polyangiaceae bacterium]